MEYLRNEIFEGILSRAEYTRDYKDKVFDLESTVLICLNFPDESSLQLSRMAGITAIHQSNFWNIEKPCNFTYPSDIITPIIDFIKKHKDKKFIIYCNNGINRSAAVGMIVEYIVKYEGTENIWNIENSEVYNYFRYKPTMLLYEDMMNILVPPVEE